MLLSLFKRQSSDTRSVQLQDGTRFNVAAGETLLDAALRCGLRPPYNCRVGACRTCRCQLVSGSAKSLVDRSYVLERHDIRNGVFLGCQTVPTTDLVLRWEMNPDPAKIHDATIVERQQMMSRVWRLSILVKAALYGVPGQHIGVSAGSGAGLHIARRFSLVNVNRAPAGTVLDVDVARQPDGAMSAWLTRDDVVGSSVKVSEPCGDCVAEDRFGLLAAVGAGSGIGAAMGVLAHSHRHAPRRATLLMAYGSTTADLYGLGALADSARQANARHRSLAWVQDCSAATPDVARGRAPAGLVPALLEHGALPGSASSRDSGCQVLLYGPPGLVDSCLAALARAGFPAESNRFDRYQSCAGTSPPAFAEPLSGG